MFQCNKKVSVWHAVLLVMAVWKDKFELAFNFSKLMEQSDKSLKIRLPASNITKSTYATTHAPTRETMKKSSKDQTLQIEKLKADILANNSQPLLTLFTSWNDNPEKYLVHNLTLSNWIALRPFVIPVIFTNEISVAKKCSRIGWETRHISVAAANGIPVLKFMYTDVMKNYNTTFYAYSNGDILFTDTLLNTLLYMKTSSIDLNKPIMMVGKRTNVDYLKQNEGSNWINITQSARKRGKIFTGCAEDYFITPRSFPWSDIEEVVIGRRAFDNWLVYKSRKAKYLVIDITETLLAVHQTTKTGNFEGHTHKNKDYNHNLLVKMYKRIKYTAGKIQCAEHYTVHENHLVIVRSRTVDKSCAV